MTEAEVKVILQDATDKRRAADQARDAMAAVLLRAMQKLLPPGTMLDLKQRRLPEYLIRVKTMSGNDRGTRKFKVVSVVRVDADPAYPDLSKWVCDAIPVSEKTGKEMSASTHAATRDTVRLHGDFGYCRDDESVDGVFDRLASLVAANA
ncbi:hypothetical protein G3A43_09335 [Paraburkholderia aspalathi]|nr:hypothetical protein [Paraburkholderia aspalathi]MBK3780428.1 hypothetical protein [Paraburkholderia aspalathi]